MQARSSTIPNAPSSPEGPPGGCSGAMTSIPADRHEVHVPCDNPDCPSAKSGDPELISGAYFGETVLSFRAEPPAELECVKEDRSADFSAECVLLVRCPTCQQQTRVALADL